MTREPLTDFRIRKRLKPGQWFRHELTGISMKRVDEATASDLEELRIAYQNERLGRRPRKRLCARLFKRIKALEGVS